MSSDPDWEEYLDFLYPDEYSYQCIQNRRVVMSLEENGNDPEILREVDHWLYLKKQEAADAFAEEVIRSGFRIIAINTVEGEEHPVQVNIGRKDNTKLPDINDTVWRLVELAGKYDGIYDGWGCTIER